MPNAQVMSIPSWFCICKCSSWTHSKLQNETFIWITLLDAFEPLLVGKIVCCEQIQIWPCNKFHLCWLCAPFAWQIYDPGVSQKDKKFTMKKCKFWQVLLFDVQFVWCRHTKIMWKIVWQLTRLHSFNFVFFPFKLKCPFWFLSVHSCCPTEFPLAAFLNNVAHQSAMEIGTIKWCLSCSFHFEFIPQFAWVINWHLCCAILIHLLKTWVGHLHWNVQQNMQIMQTMEMKILLWC